MLLIFQIRKLVTETFIHLIILIILSLVFSIQSTKETDFAAYGQYFVIIILLFTNIKKNITSHSIFKTCIVIAWFSFALIVLASTIKLFHIGYSHQNTYESIYLFSHRNLLLNYFVVNSILMIKVLKPNKKFTLSVIILMFVAAVLFQVKTALLITIFCHIIFFRNVWKLYVIGVAIIFIVNIPRFISFKTDKNIYTEEIALMPAWKKNFDLIYITKLAGSSNDRINSWIWTIKNSNFMGHGPGSWKLNSQGKISLRNKDCTSILRRPHNDFLLLIYEFGILGFLISLIIIYTLYINGLIMLIPLFLFTFPLERAGFVSIFLLVKPISINISSHILYHKILKYINLGLSLFCVFIFTSVFIAYTTYFKWGRELSTPNAFSVTKQKSITRFIKRDFLLNHHLKYEAFSALKTGDKKMFSDNITTLYSMEPNFYTTFSIYRDLKINDNTIPYSYKYVNGCE